MGISPPSVRSSAKNNLSAASAPTTANDNTQGYSVGSIWQNASTAQIWQARSVTTGAAVWTMLEFSDFPGYIAGNWYIPETHGGAVTNGNASATSIIFFTPGFIKQRATINSLGIVITTLAAGGHIQAAIYANNPVTGRPTGAALCSTASMSTASATNVNAAASCQLEPGLYWFAINMDNSTSAYRAYSITSTAPMASIIGSATQANSLSTTASLASLSAPQTFGTWPDVTAATFTEQAGSNFAPVVQFKIASVP